MAFGSQDQISEVLLRAKAEGLEQLKALENGIKSASSAEKAYNEQMQQMQASHAANTKAIDSLTAAINQNAKALQSRSQSTSQSLKQESVDWQSLGNTVKKALSGDFQGAFSDAGKGLQSMSGDAKAFAGEMGLAAESVVAIGAVAGSLAVVGAGLVGVTLLAKNLGDEAERILNTSARTGLTASEVQQLQTAAKYAGIEVGVFEGMMKGLTRTLTDTSKEAEDARTALMQMGVSTRTTSGELRSTKDILLDIADGLDKIPDGVQKQERAIEIFGRMGGQILPLLNGELRQNIELQKQWQSYFTDEEVQKFSKIDKAFDTMGLGLEALAKRSEVALANMFHLVQLADRIDKYLHGQANTLTGGNLPDNFVDVAKAVEADAAKTPKAKTPADLAIEAFDRSKGKTIQGLNEIIAKAKETQKELDAAIHGGEGTEAIARDVQKYNEQSKIIANAQAQIDAINKSKEASKKAADDQKRAIDEANKAYESFTRSIGDSAAKAKGPLEELTFKFDELNKKFGGKANSTEKSVARSAYIGEMVRLQAAEFDAIDKSMRDFEKGTDDQILREAEERSKVFVDHLNDAVRSTMASLYNPDFAYADSTRVSNLQTKEQRDAQLRSLTAGPGNEERVINENYLERLDTAKKIYDINLKDAQLELERANTSGDATRIEKAKFELVKTTGDYQKEIDDAKYNRQISYLELQQKELENYKQAAGRIFDAVTASGGDGLKNFFSTELKTVERQLFVNASGLLFSNSSLGLGNLIPGQRDSSGNLTGTGKLLQGTLFGNKGSVEDYTRRTAIATEKIATGITTGANGLPGLNVTAGGILGSAGSLISDANGITGDIASLPLTSKLRTPLSLLGVGGGTSTTIPHGLGAFLGGAAGLAAGANVWNAITGEDYGIQTGPGQAVTASSKGYMTPAGRAGTLVGAAGALYAGTMGAIQGFSEGGVGGISHGSASILGTVAALDPEPVSKAVFAAGALVMGIVGDIFGRNKQKRQQEIDSYISKNQHNLPEAITRDLDISGADAIYQSNGNVRAATAPTYNVTITALDSKSIHDLAMNNAATFASAVDGAMQLGHPIRSTITQQFWN